MQTIAKSTRKERENKLRRKVERKTIRFRINIFIFLRRARYRKSFLRPQEEWNIIPRKSYSVKPGCNSGRTRLRLTGTSWILGT